MKRFQAFRLIEKFYNNFNTNQTNGWEKRKNETIQYFLELLPEIEGSKEVAISRFERNYYDIKHLV
jgi:hypothetical protein